MPAHRSAHRIGRPLDPHRRGALRSETRSGARRGPAAEIAYRDPTKNEMSAPSSALLHAQAFNGLAGDIGYHLKVLVEVQDREPG